MCTAADRTVLLFSAAGAILSYMLAREGGALWDDRFQAGTGQSASTGSAMSAWSIAQAWLVDAVPHRLRLADPADHRASCWRSASPANARAAQRDVRRDTVRDDRHPAVGLCSRRSSNYRPPRADRGRFPHVNPWAGYTHLADYQGACATARCGPIDSRTDAGHHHFPELSCGSGDGDLVGFLVKPRRSCCEWAGRGRRVGHHCPRRRSTAAIIWST